MSEENGDAAPPMRLVPTEANNGHSDTYVIPGTKTAIHYRRAPADDARRLYRSCTTETGEHDPVEATNRILEAYVTGWDHMTDAEGKSAPFSTDLLRPGLPADVKVAIELKITTKHAEAASGKGDSPGT